MKTTEKQRQYMKEYYKRNKDKALARAAVSREKMKKKNPYYQACKKYGVSLETILQQIESQFGACIICSQPETAKDNYGKTRLLCVDHCHTTGEARAMLCTRCNSAVGLIKEDPRVALNLYNYINYFKTEGANGES